MNVVAREALSDNIGTLTLMYSSVVKMSTLLAMTPFKGTVMKICFSVSSQV